MVNSKKSVMTKAAAIAMSITMLTSALSFGVSASAEELDDTTTTTTTSTTSTGPVVACPIEDGVLYISIEGGQWKHWIEYASGESTSGYGTLDVKTINGVETFIYSDIDGNVIIQWDEEPSSNTNDRGKSTETTEEENEIENDGKVDVKIAEQLLNMLYEEQRALNDEVAYFDGLYNELKASILEASTFKTVLKNSMSESELTEITEYINVAKKERSYAYAQRNRFNSAAIRCGNEVRALEKKLGKSNTVVDISGGEGAEEKDYGTGGLSFWKSSAYEKAASNSYGEVSDKIVTFSDSEKLFLKAINEYKMSSGYRVYGIITVRSKSETYYLKYFSKEKAVYRVSTNGKKLSETPEYSTADIAKGLLKNYKVAYDKLKQGLNYDYAVYSAAKSFYEEKGALLYEKYNTLQDYKKENKNDLSKEELAALDIAINALGGTAKHFYTVKATKVGERYTSTAINLYKNAANEAAKYANTFGVFVDSSSEPEGNESESDG